MYELGYVRLLAPRRPERDAAALGTSFHALVAAAAKQASYDPVHNQQLEVALAYLKHNPLPSSANILVVDSPQYIPIGDDWLRWTPDLVYQDGQTIKIRDYKTFDKKPSLDTEMDFQARIYIACAMRKYKTDNVWFEHEYVRRTPPGVPHNKAGDTWTPGDCYIRIPLVISRAEADRLWEETRWVLEDIKATTANNRWYRQCTRDSFYGCCGEYRDLCKAEMQQGALDQGTIDALSTPREPLKLPEGLK